MAINFPSNPIDGATFYAAGNTYIFEANGNRWRARASFSVAAGTSELSGDTDIIYDGGDADQVFLSTLDGGTS